MPDRKTLYLYIDRWEAMKEKLHTIKDAKADFTLVMREAIKNYQELLIAFGYSDQHATATPILRIEPLNGKERLQFVEKTLNKRYAIIQLDALYTEAKKKAAQIIAIG
ncbi:YpoC family protein [Sporosarcina contaminans]|uniref:YpoC family protein n=1 Tax=Sporosarcina contaminans TaxID=633403 RepID=A0ABW3TX71_9BACL